MTGLAAGERHKAHDLLGAFVELMALGLDRDGINNRLFESCITDACPQQRAQLQRVLLA